MDTASKILILGGVLNLAYALLLGLPLSAVRLKSAVAPKYLMDAHIGPLMFGPILISLVLAIEMSKLSSTWETAAAALLVAASVALAVKDTLNWLQGVKDGFAERSIGFYLGTVVALTSLAGLGIVTAGVVLAL